MNEYAAVEANCAQALFAAHAFETALYALDPWTMRWGPLVVAAQRNLTETGVEFTGVFPDLCWIDPPEGAALLLCGDQIVGMRRIDHPGDTQFVVRWSFATERVSV